MNSALRCVEQKCSARSVRIIGGVGLILGSWSIGAGAVPEKHPVAHPTSTFDHNTSVRVILTQGVQRMTLQGHARIDAVGHPVAQITAGESFSVFLSQNRVWLITGRGLHTRTTQVATPLTLSPPSNADVFTLDRKRYHGSLTLERNERGLLVINKVSLHDYLVGTVGSEMPASWPLAALAAQTVAARTYAIERIGLRKKAIFDLENTTKDQVYTGIPTSADRVTRVVEKTDGEYLAENGKPIRAYYHARCGGYADHPTTIWGDHSSPAAVIVCPYCLKNLSSWKISIPRRELGRLLNLPQTLGLSLRLVEGERTPGGRLKQIRGLTSQSELNLNAEKLRSLIGYSRLKSTRFHWQTDRQNITFHGVGEGHGVGLCQWGARGLARDGSSYDQILTHYYPNASLARPVAELADQKRPQLRRAERAMRRPASG